MEKIGKHNYEAFMLDYMEGNLNEAGIRALFAFFEQCPELKPEFLDQSEQVILEAEPLSFPGKMELKHTKEEVEERVIAYLEGLLPDDEKAAFEKELYSNPSLLLVYNDYQKTILAADEVSFAGKSSLKHTLIPEEELIAYSEGILSPAQRPELEKQLSADPVAQQHLHVYNLAKLSPDTAIVYPDKAALKRGGLIVYLNEYWKPLSIAASLVLLIGLFFLLRNGDSNDPAMKHSLANKQNVNKTSGNKQEKDSVAGSVDNKINQSTNTNNQQVAHNGLKNKKGTATTIDNQSNAALQNNSAINQGQVPLANNNSINTTKGVDTSNRGINALALVNLERNQYSFNYYDESEEEAKGDGEKKNTLSTKEFVAKKLTEAAWGDEQQTADQKVEKKKLTGFDVLALIGKGLKKLGNRHSDAKKVEAENGKGSDYIVTIGGVSVTRHKAN